MDTFYVYITCETIYILSSSPKHAVRDCEVPKHLKGSFNIRWYRFYLQLTVCHLVIVRIAALS